MGTNRTEITIDFWCVYVKNKYDNEHEKKNLVDCLNLVDKFKVEYKMFVRNTNVRWKKKTNRKIFSSKMKVPFRIHFPKQ